MGTGNKQKKDMDKKAELDTALLDLDKFRRMCHPDNYYSETVKGMAAEFYKQLTPALDITEGMVLREQREMEEVPSPQELDSMYPKYIKIPFNRRVTITRHANPNERWDSEWTLDHSGITIRRSDSHDSLPLNSKLESILVNCGYVYVVYLIYSTGDSFGTFRCSDLIHIGVYESAQEAEEIQDAILHDAKVNKDTNSITLPDGKQFTCCWKGYFEALDHVRVERIQLSRYND